MSEAFKPKVVKNVIKNLKYLRAQKKKYFNKNAKTLPVLCPGQPIRMRSKTSNEYDKKGVIRGNHKGNPRSYVVESETKQYVRNRRDILQIPINNPPKLTATPDASSNLISANIPAKLNQTQDEPEAIIEKKPQTELQIIKAQVLDENPRPEVKPQTVTISGRISRS